MFTTTARYIADYLTAEFSGEVAGVEEDFPITRLAAIASPAPNSFGFAKRPAPDGARIPETMLVVVGTDVASRFQCPKIIVQRPRLAFAMAARHLLRQDAAGGTHPSAIVHPSAQVEPGATIGANSVIGAYSRIGARTSIAHNVVIGERVSIGTDCVIRSGTVIGEDGFGVEEFGEVETVRLPHVGGVHIGNNVEIGSLCSIASGTIEPTIIEDYVQTDNLVHIAHNVRVGAGTQIAACAEISGSVSIGKRVYIGPNASIINAIGIGDDCLIGIATFVRKECEPNGVFAGSPAKRLRDRR